MAGEGDAGMQSEDQILSDALETFDRGMGSAGAPGEPTAAGPQGDEPGSAGAAAGSHPGETGQSGGGRAGTSSQTAAGASAGGGGYRTDAERVAELDRELDGRMGAFDGMLLEERAQILAAGETGDDVGGEDDPYGGGAGGEENEGSGSAGDFGAGGEDGDGAPPLLTRGGAGGGGGIPDAKGGGRTGDYEQVAMGGPVPQDIPNADGDDVVARQLREAAMRETDPVLREKLWNEYRKYKGLPAK